MAAVAFSSGQKIKFPSPHDNIIAYFEYIRYEKGEPIIGYSNDDLELKEMRGYHLFDIQHA